MINKKKFRIIGDVANWENASQVLDLREIAKNRKQEKEIFIKKHLVNLKPVKQEAEESLLESKHVVEEKDATKIERPKEVVELVENIQLAPEQKTEVEKDFIAKKSENNKEIIGKKEILNPDFLVYNYQESEGQKVEETRTGVNDFSDSMSKEKNQASHREVKNKNGLLTSWRKNRIAKIKAKKKVDTKKEALLLARRQADLEKNALEKIWREHQRALIHEEKLKARLVKNERKNAKPKHNYGLLFFNRLNRGFKFSLIGFVIVCAIMMSSVKGLDFFNTQAKDTKSKILSDAGVAYQYINSAAGSAKGSDFQMASYKFNIAADRFLGAQSDLNQYGQVITSVLGVLPGGSAVRSGENLLSAGANLSKAGEYLTSAVEPFKNIGGFMKIDGSSDQKASLTESISVASNNLQMAIDKLDQANENLKNVKTSDLPPDIAPKISTIKDNLPQITSNLKVLVGYSDYFLEMLGHKGPKRYLVLLENNRELRPTGGFMGTYALVDVDSGRITNMKIEGPYNLDGGLQQKIIAPEPLRLIQVKSFFRDSNWFLDFPMSAKNIMSMYEKSGGPTVDGVFTVTGNVMESLLNVIGGIDMPQYNTKITADNFFEETQWQVEDNYDKTLNEPKQFVKDMFPMFVDRLTNLDKSKWLEVANTFYKMLDQKDIMMYFTDDKIEDFAKSFNWTGEVKDTNKDYLSVVETNIGGGKTDSVVDQKVLHEATIAEDGSVIDTVTITRSHNGDPNDAWTGIKNMAYMRVYVPLGSEMIEAKGFDKEFWGYLRPLEDGSVPDPTISGIENNMRVNNDNGIRIMQEGNKTVFGDWMNIECGQTKTAVIKYKLPFKIINVKPDPALSYNLFIQKQPGTKANDTTSILSYPKDYYVQWKYTSDNLLTDVDAGLQYRTNLNKDKMYAVVFVK